MRRLLLSVLGVLAAIGATAQTPQFVSTEAANRNVVIEEFTGVNCGYCPDGHKIVREYEQTNPGRVFGINVHQGGYASMYTTQWGNALNAQSGMAGSYPMATVNRHVFSGGITGMGRGSIVACGNQIKAMPSFVNIAAEATIDATTRLLTVNVEAYYTADAETGSNLINVALLQDSIIGPQSGGANFNPDQVTADGQYIHLNMLRDLLTGQWGDEVSVAEGVIPAGTLVQRTYTYTIPAVISNEVMKLDHLKLVVFITKDHQEIYTGSECKPVVSNYPALSALPAGLEAENIWGCSDNVKSYFSVYNAGGDAITSLDIQYSSSLSAAQTYAWSGSIAAGAVETIELPDVLANIGTNTEVNAQIVSANGTAVTTEQMSATIKKKAPAEGVGDTLKIVIQTDQYASEAGWALEDAQGNTLAHKHYTGNSIKKDTIFVALPEIGCYVFKVTDDYGDGGTKHQVFDATGRRLVNGGATSYGTMAAYDIKITSLTGIENVEGAILQTLAYPNPAKDKVMLEISMLQSTLANITVVDMLGREVIRLGEVNLSTGKNTVEVNTSSLSNGTYLVKIISDNGMVSKKISINR